MGAGFAGFPTQPLDAPVSADVAVLGIPMGVTYPGRTSHSATAPRPPFASNPTASAGS